MKILHLISDIYEGGVATIVYELGKFQVAEGHEVTVVCSITNPKQVSGAEIFLKAGIEMVFAPFKSSYDPRLIIFFKKIFPKFDIVHVHHFPNQFFAQLAMGLVPCSRRPVLITTEHSTYNNRRRIRLLRLVDRWMYGRYQKVVCISNQTEQCLRDWLKLPDDSNGKNIVTIQNGVDLQKFKHNNIHVASVKNIVMVSRLEAPKDPLTVVRAIKRCDDNVHLNFVGSGSLENSIRKLSDDLNISNRVHLLGNRNDVPKILEDATIGVLSTEWEGFGLVLVEYMAAGLPVLVSDADGMRDIVCDEEAIFPIGNDEALANKINWLLNDREKYNNRRKYSLLRCQSFSVETMNRSYLDVYDTLLTSQRVLNLS